MRVYVLMGCSIARLGLAISNLFLKSLGGTSRLNLGNNPKYPPNPVITVPHLIVLLFSQRRKSEPDNDVAKSFLLLVLPDQILIISILQMERELIRLAEVTPATDAGLAVIYPVRSNSAAPMKSSEPTRSLSYTWTGRWLCCQVVRWLVLTWKVSGLSGDSMYTLDWLFHTGLTVFFFSGVRCSSSSPWCTGGLAAGEVTCSTRT